MKYHKSPTRTHNNTVCIGVCKCCGPQENSVLAHRLLAARRLVREGRRDRRLLKEELRGHGLQPSVSVRGLATD